MFRRERGGYGDRRGGGRGYGDSRGGPRGYGGGYGRSRREFAPRRFEREEREEEYAQREYEREPREPRPEMKEIKIVFPGDELADSLEIIPGYGTYRAGSKIFSKVIGIMRSDGHIITVVPLTGVYVPRRGDYVIAEIKDLSFSNWTVDINSPYEAQLSVTDAREYIPKGADISKFYNIGDLIFAKVSIVTTTKFVNVTMRDPKARKLIGGLVTNITPAKVPRLIGHGGSMINLIKDKTKCSITVGQNGRVWVKGEYEDIAAEAIEMVNKMAHVSGLTDKVAAKIDESFKARGITPPVVTPVTPAAAVSVPQEPQEPQETAESGTEEDARRFEGVE